MPVASWLTLSGRTDLANIGLPTHRIRRATGPRVLGETCLVMGPTSHGQSHRLSKMDQNLAGRFPSLRAR